jgi:hypothetical protein
MNVPKDKMTGGENRGKCYFCGLPTNLHVHQKCSDKYKGVKKVKKEPVFKTKTCGSVDCTKEFTPTGTRQKLCHDCSKKNKSINRTNHYNCRG